MILGASDEDTSPFAARGESGVGCSSPLVLSEVKFEGPGQDGSQAFRVPKHSVTLATLGINLTQAESHSPRTNSRLHPRAVWVEGASWV